MRNTLAALTGAVALAAATGVLLAPPASAYACPPLFEYHTYTVAGQSVSWCRLQHHCDPAACDLTAVRT